MMPWKKHQKAAAEGAAQARREYEESRRTRAKVEGIADALRYQSRRNGWMEDLDQIMGGRA